MFVEYFPTRGIHEQKVGLSQIAVQKKSSIVGATHQECWESLLQRSDKKLKWRTLGGLWDMLFAVAVEC